MWTALLIVGRGAFFSELWDKYAQDLLDFLHTKLERLIGLALLCWLLLWLLRVAIVAASPRCTDPPPESGTVKQSRTMFCTASPIATPAPPALVGSGPRLNPRIDSVCSVAKTTITAIPVVQITDVSVFTCP